MWQDLLQTPENGTEKDELDQGPRRKFARVLARGLLKRAGITEAPVSLQRVIEHVQKDRNLTVIMAKIPEQISGIIVRVRDLESESVSIGINADKPWCRRRFTLGHELGHMLMEHAGCSGGVGEETHEEREAQIFAAELLIPKALISLDLKKNPNIPVLAKIYRVSEEALTIQLRQHHLI